MPVGSRVRLGHIKKNHKIEKNHIFFVRGDQKVTFAIDPKNGVEKVRSNYMKIFRTCSNPKIFEQCSNMFELRTRSAAALIQTQKNEVHSNTQK